MYMQIAIQFVYIVLRFFIPFNAATVFTIGIMRISVSNGSDKYIGRNKIKTRINSRRGAIHFLFNFVYPPTR